MKLKMYLLITITLLMIAWSTFMILSPLILTAHITGLHNLNIENFDETRSKLDRVFQQISRDTGADIVWINLFHTDPKFDGVLTDSNTKDAILLTALHHYIKPGYKISIRLARNQPISKLPQIDETLRGKCIVRQNASPNPYELQEVPIKRLVLRCPLYDNNENLIGIYGLSFFYFDSTTTDVEDFIENNSTKLKTYRENIISILFG